MADLITTPGSMATTGTPTISDSTFGATVVATKCVYFDQADSKWKLAIASSAAAAGSAGIGIAFNGGADGQPGKIVTKAVGGVNLGVVLVVGARYYVSKNAAGGIMPEADLITGDFVTLLGIAISTSLLRLEPIATGIQVP